jgi:sugar phosphate isomerase/epimerase
MLIGAMNHPGRDILGELQWINELGFDFVDLTLEPPMAAVSSFKVEEVKGRLNDSGLGIVGHTAYLPICSPFESIRAARWTNSSAVLTFSSRLGAQWMNLHPDPPCPVS